MLGNNKLKSKGLAVILEAVRSNEDLAYLDISGNTANKTKKISAINKGKSGLLDVIL